MAKYYLIRGYNLLKNWKSETIKKINLTLSNLEDIDTFTAGFTDLNDLKKFLMSQGLINSMNEDIAIGTEKYDKFAEEKIMIKIYNGEKLIFRSDLYNFSIFSRFDNYLELADKIWEYVKKRANDKQFMRYIVSDYITKYGDSNSKVKAPIYKDGSLFVLENCLNSPEYAKYNRNEYQLCFCNFFFNELYKCERKKSYSGTVFVANKNKINEKGLHDLLVHIIDYIKEYELNKKESYKEEEEFLENRDFERPLKKYLKENNIKDIEKDDYATSLIIDKDRLVRKTDGME